MFRNPLVIFIGSVVLLGLLFFLFPINVFDGVIVYKQGLQIVEVETPLSLSYFIGLNLDPEQMEGVVENYYLTTKGVVMAFLFIIGFPAILAYRFYLKS